MDIDMGGAGFDGVTSRIAVLTCMHGHTPNRLK